jgi:hypothetical protein
VIFLANEELKPKSNKEESADIVTNIDHIATISVDKLFKINGSNTIEDAILKNVAP